MELIKEETINPQKEENKIQENEGKIFRIFYEISTEYALILNAYLIMSFPHSFHADTLAPF